MLIRQDYKAEIAPIEKPIIIGEHGTGRVKKAQEWMNLHAKYYNTRFKSTVGIDDDFGNATFAAIKDFQYSYNLEVTGVIDQLTWSTMISPMQSAYREIKFEENVPMATRVVAYMEQFCQEHPVEIPNNRGPWVRSFMKGMEWDSAAWCDGAVSTAIDHAASSMDKTMDEFIPWTWSCFDTVKFATSGNYKCKFFQASEVQNNPGIVKSGDLGLVMGDKGPQHIFVVQKMNDSIMTTIEGNTNDDGSRDGYEMCYRKRDAASGKYAIVKFE